jgi:hypothetical protein
MAGYASGEEGAGCSPDTLTGSVRFPDGKFALYEAARRCAYAGLLHCCAPANDREHLSSPLRHCEERSDEAIRGAYFRIASLLRASQMTIMAVISVCLFEEYSHSQT